MGGHENILRPNCYRNFGRLDKTARLIAAMTCMECGIPMKEVDMEAVWQGYDLAWPGLRVKMPEEEEDLTVWDEYWNWSSLA